MAESDSTGSYFTEWFVNTVIIGHCLRGDAWTPPANWYVQKHTGDPSAAGTANVSTTATRQAIPWSPGAAGVTLLGADLSFLSSSKEPIAYLTMWDASAGGHCAAVLEFAEVVNCGVGDTLAIGAAAGSVGFPVSAG